MNRTQNWYDNAPDACEQSTFPFQKSDRYDNGTISFPCERSLKDVHRRQKLTTDFFSLLELTILVVNISISRKKICLPWFPGGHFLRGLITKSQVLSIFNSSDDRFFSNLNPHRSSYKI